MSKFKYVIGTTNATVRYAAGVIAEFLSKPIARGWMLVGLICLFLGFGGYAYQISRQHIQSQQLTQVTQRLRADERVSCDIQKQVLPEGPELSKIFGDIDRLIILPQSVATKRLERQLNSAKAYDRQQQAINELHNALSVFRVTVGGEPLTRSCIF